MWTSPDGREWERVAADDPALAGEGETRLSKVIPHAGGIYLTGEHGSTERRRECEAGGGPAATSCAWGIEHGWVSADGATWERVDPALAAGNQPIEFRLIVAGGPGLVLIGESSLPDSPDTNVFTSTDGREWTPVQPQQPIRDGVAMTLAVRDREVIAIAEHSGAGEPRWQVWVGTVR